MEIICAFSSDNRALYIADIYRVLSLPEGHIMHFRYKVGWVDENLLYPGPNLKNKDVAIFYTHGNNATADSVQSHISVRRAQITHTESSSETNVFHVYMKLEGFCNISIDSGNSEEKKPPAKYFTSLKCTERSSENNWQARVNAVKDHFPNITFFHVKGIYSGRRRLPIKYKDKNKFCYYSLTHGDRYTIKLALGNPQQSNTKIELHDSSEEITINCINPLETSAEFDDYEIPISVKTLHVMKQASLLNFGPKEKGADLGEYSTNIELNLYLTIKRPFIFGTLSLMAFWALLLAKPMSSSAQWPSVTMLVASSLMFWLASGSLFYWFNKK